jgi:hypothetical protein
MPPDNSIFPAAPQIINVFVDGANTLDVAGSPFDPVLMGDTKYEGLPIGFALIPTLKLRLNLDTFDKLPPEMQDLRDYLLNPIVADNSGLLKGEGQPVELTPIFTLYDSDDRILFRGIIRRDPKSKYTFEQTELPFDLNLAHIYRAVLESTRLSDAADEYRVMALTDTALAMRTDARLYEFAYAASGGTVAQAQIGAYANSVVKLAPFHAVQKAIFRQAEKIYRRMMRNDTVKFEAANSIFSGIEFFQQFTTQAEYQNPNVPKTYAELQTAITNGTTWKRLSDEQLYIVAYEFVAETSSAIAGDIPAYRTGMLTDMEGGFLDYGDAWTLFSRMVQGLARKSAFGRGTNANDIITNFNNYTATVSSQSGVFASTGKKNANIGNRFKYEHYLQAPTSEEGGELIAGVELTTKYVPEGGADITQHRMELEGSDNDENWSGELVLHNMPLVGKSNMSDRSEGSANGDISGASTIVHWKGFNRYGLYYFAQPPFATRELCFRVNDVVAIDTTYISKRADKLDMPSYSSAKGHWETVRRQFRDIASTIQKTSCLGFSLAGYLLNRFAASEQIVSNNAAGLPSIKALDDSPVLVGMPGVVVDGSTINIGDTIFHTGNGALYSMSAAGYVPTSLNGATEFFVTEGLTHQNEVWRRSQVHNEYGIAEYQWSQSGTGVLETSTRLIPKRGIIFSGKVRNDLVEITQIEEGVPVTQKYLLVAQTKVGERYVVDRLRTYLTHIPTNGILTGVSTDYIEDEHSISLLLFDEAVTP